MPALDTPPPARRTVLPARPAFVGEPPSVASVAQQIYDNRVQYGLPGDAASDWREAELLVQNHQYDPPKPEIVRSMEEFRASVNERRQAARARSEELRKFFLDRSTCYIPRFSRALGGVARAAGCGPSVLASLTGEHPLALKAKYDVEGLSEEVMVKHLREHGYEITELTDEHMKHDNGVMTTPLTAFNVVLVSFRATKDKNSWGIVWGNHLMHTFHSMKFERYTFLNHTVLAKFLVWHPTWMNNDDMAELIRKSDPDPEGKPFEQQTQQQRDATFRDRGLFQMLFSTIGGLGIGPELTDEFADAED